MWINSFLIKQSQKATWYFSTTARGAWAKRWRTRRRFITSVVIFNGLPAFKCNLLPNEQWHTWSRLMKALPKILPSQTMTVQLTINLCKKGLLFTRMNEDCLLFVFPCQALNLHFNYCLVTIFNFNMCFNFLLRAYHYPLSLALLKPVLHVRLSFMFWMTV